MALPILDGNQTATTLATTVSGSAHYPNHIIASGTVTANAGGDFSSSIENVYDVGNVSKKIAVQLYDDNGSAVGVTNNPLPIYGTVTANLGSALPTGTNRIGVVTIGAGTVTIGAGTAQIGSVTASGTVTANIGGIANSVTLPVRLFAEKFGEAPSGQDTLLVCNSSGMLLVDANSGGSSVLGYDGNAFVQVKQVPGSSVTIGNSVTISSLPALVAGTAQIGSVTASISNSLTIGSLPALVAGTAQIGSVTASISNSVTIASLPAISGTVTANLSISSSAITSGSFTSLTSATLVPANTARKMATVYNLGAGQLFINAGASATTLGGGFMVALNSGDFYECGYTTTTLSAIFATAGTASWVSH
jgi:hypothetical protein